MNRRYSIFMLILISMGLAACGGGGPTDNSNPRVLFKETWEDYPVGSFPAGGWRNSTIPFINKIIDNPPNHKLLINGPAPNAPDPWGSVLYYDFKPGTMKPTYIRYNIHPYPNHQEPGIIRPDYSVIGHFRLADLTVTESPWLAIDVHFEHYADGLGQLYSNTFKYPFNPISLDRAFLIELRNIHWESTPHTYDIWINGIERETCIPFLQDVDSFTRLFFFNQTYGKFHVDDIYMADLPIEYHCPVVSEDPPTRQLPPAVPPSDPVLFIFEMPAFCRSGPSTEYPKISSYPEGTELEIRGQNLEGTWWWSEEGGCWVSDIVGQLSGDITTLEIIIPPLPSGDIYQLEDSSDQQGECSINLGEAACIGEGGTWDDQPGQPGICVCP